MNSRFKTYIEGPRWAGTEKFLIRTANEFDLEIETRVDRGWIRETVYFTVTGSHDNLERFKSRVQRALLEMNR